MALIQASNSIVAYEGRPTAVAKSILNQLVSSGTQENFANHNFYLILWIYEKDEWSEALLMDWTVECLITVEAEGKKAMRAAFKAVLKSIDRNYDNCPILLEKIAFNPFSHTCLSLRV